MIKIQNPEIITNLIKEGCPIDLERLEDIDLIISMNHIKTAKDYQKVMNYIQWHAEKTSKQVLGWNFEPSFDMYIEYLQKMSEFLGEIIFDPQPKEDIYEILRLIYKTEEQINNKYKRIIRKETIKQIKENKKDLRKNWWKNP